MKQLLTIMFILALAGTAWTMPTGTAEDYFGEGTAYTSSVVVGVCYDNTMKLNQVFGYAWSLGKGFYVIPQYARSSTDNSDQIEGYAAFIKPLFWRFYGGIIGSPITAKFIDNPELDLDFLSGTIGLIAGCSLSDKVTVVISGKMERPWDGDLIQKFGENWAAAFGFTYDLGKK